MSLTWATPNSMPHLEDGALHIWRADLGGPHGRELLAYAFQALTSEERQRAARMRSGTAPEEFIAGRGFLRRLLGIALDCDPQGVGIVIGPFRKPELRSIRGIQSPCFNVSHSRGVVLIALSQAGPVGVDIEYMDSSVEIDDVARAAFSAQDLADIDGAPTQEEKLMAFYRCWTRREAVAKADGRGLSMPASSFSIARDGSGGSDLHPVDIHPEDGHRGPVRRYYVRSLDVTGSHQGAVAVRHRESVPQLFEISPMFRVVGASHLSRAGELAHAGGGQK